MNIEQFEKLSHHGHAKREVERPLTHLEYQQLGTDLATIAKRIKSANIAKKLAAKFHKEEIESLEEEQDNILTIWNDKHKDQLADVIVAFDWQSGQKWFLDEETGRIYGPEPVTLKDRQQRLSFVDVCPTCHSTQEKGSVQVCTRCVESGVGSVPYCSSCRGRHLAEEHALPSPPLQIEGDVLDAELVDDESVCFECGTDLVDGECPDRDCAVNVAFDAPDEGEQTDARTA